MAEMIAKLVLGLFIVGVAVWFSYMSYWTGHQHGYMKAVDECDQSNHRMYAFLESLMRAHRKHKQESTRN